MSNLKYKVGDKFYLKRDISFFLIIDKVEENEYTTISEDGSDYLVGDEILDSDYVKDNTKKEKQEHVWENPSDFKKMTSSFSDMLEEKNKRYGNAALEPLSIVSKHHKLGAKIDEKLSRIKNAETLKKNDLADVIGYCFLICKDMGWDNFDDQLD